MPIIISPNRMKKSRKRAYRGLYLFVLGYTIGLSVYTIKLTLLGFQGSIFTYILVLVAIIALLLHQFLPDAVRTRLSQYKMLIIFIFSIGFVWYLFGLNLQAQFGIIDDYQIVRYIGADNQMSILEIPQILRETEVGKPGNFPRYRPSYFTIRVGESFLWGKNPFLWYFARLGIALLFVMASWYLLQDYIGFMLAGLFVLYIFTFPLWADILARLGPSEAYALLGMVIFIFGFNTILRNQSGNANIWQNVVNWAFVTVGILIAIGSKENFLVLLFPMFGLLYLAFKNKHGRWIASVSSILVFSYAIFIIWAVGTALGKIGITIHAQSVSAISRWDVFLGAVKTVDSQTMIFFGILVGVFLCYARFIRRDKQLERTVLIALSLLLSCYALFISQFVFYNGEWPVGNRYDFPGILYKPFLYLVMGWLLIKTLQILKVSIDLRLGLIAGFVVGLALIIAPDNFVHIRTVSQHNVERTQAFATRLDLVTEQMNAYPNAALVIESHAVSDYEPIYGWATYLAANGVTNPIFLRLHTYSSTIVASDLKKLLAGILEETSQEGGRGFNSIQQLDAYSSNCFSLQLSGATDTECIDIK